MRFPLLDTIMPIRETFQKHSGAVAVGGVLLTIACLAVIRSEVKEPRDFSGVGKTFYSDDDGKTWFLDDPAKGSPFDHNGNQAYRAIVFRCPGGTPFVAFLAKFSDQEIAQDAAAMAHAPPGTPSRLSGMPLENIKKPGESKWTMNSNPSMNGFPLVNCPGGGGPASLVLPADPDSGAMK
jgi:hypothetical protein